MEKNNNRKLKWILMLLLGIVIGYFLDGVAEGISNRLQ
jgi:hypothetical protein